MNKNTETVKQEAPTTKKAHYEAPRLKVVELRPETVDLLDFVGILEPPDGRHVTIEEMNEDVGHAVAESFQKSVHK